MVYIFLSLMYEIENETEYLKKSQVGLPTSINTFQNNLLNGFSTDNDKMLILNTLPFGTFPKKYRQLFFKTNIIKKNNIEYYKNIGYINLQIIKHLCRYNNYKKELKKIIKNNINNDLCIIAYSLYYPFIDIMLWIKKYFPEVKSCLIVPDLPSIYGVLPQNKIKKYISLLYGEITLKKAINIDSFILFTKQMSDIINKRNKPYIITEGIVTAGKSEIIMPIGNKRIVMYAGALMYEFSIHNLLEAFSIIKDENYELWICGSGDAAEEVKAFEKNDNRITYYGYLNKQETLSLQKKATILINPRSNNGEYTKYSFPSKTVEYMNSGKPIIMYKLDGLPDEYEPYLFIPEDNTPDSLAKKIMEVGSYCNEELYTIGSKAQKWIQENKNCLIQANKIKNMIKSELFEDRGIQ